MHRSNADSVEIRITRRDSVPDPYRQHPTRTAHVALWIFLIANLAIVELMVATATRPAAYNLMHATGRFLGLHWPS